VHLDRFEAELQVLSQHISLESDNITRAQQDALSRSYWECVDELVASHSDIISYGDSAAVELRKGSRITNQYRQALEGQLTRAVQHLQSTSTDLSSTSQAWIDLALAGLSLYIPNYPHDPALQPMIERKLFNQKKAALVKKLQALQEFQLSFTGQETSFRIRYTEGQIEAMGQEPPVPAIARPEVSELDSLQGEFTNLLSLVQPLLNGTISAQEASHDETLRSNLTRIIGRLVDGYRSYDDITGSAVGFLACLHIGLTLGAQAAHQVNSIRRSLEYVTQHTPFFGITGLQEDSRINSLIQHCESELSQGQHAIDLRMHALHCIALARNVELDITSRPGIRRILHDIFASYYSEWRQKLLQDQEKEAINSSLYTYKGGDEELDEEDPELFPDYEKEEDEQAPASSTSREHAIRLSNMHAELFHATSPPEESLKALLEWSTSQIVRVADGQAHGTKHENAMPAIFLALDKKADALSSSGAGKGYNFYFDSNITEAKRLITLIHRIQRRYRQIRNVWPEHATLSDVLRTCDEALEFRHVDPVAKFITKGEKLHSYMYEWERVASREFSTATLFDDLTKLLVSWRQLELTTWARLFDIEIEKCKDNARGWFFVAYETIVAAPESIQDEKEMRQHAKDLLKTLEGFFSSTTLGQFKQRMGLLEQLREHLAMRMQDVAFFSIVHLALDNLIAYLGRLEKPVQEALSKGRQALEKTVSEVIQLASWKDTNIEALKQSAKTSHRKLSKLVRKFRALLNQPVSGIYHAGFPEETVITADINMGQIDTTLSPNVLDLLDRIPDWAAQPTRFRNPSATVSIMRSKSSVSAENVDSAKYIESFIVDLETVITELQKATPPTLTEKNKETVQHLKTRKRKLYADTMKELRQMGIKSNLSSDVLVKQDELSTVLASLPTVKSRTTGSEYFLHKALNVMSQVRDITKEHSGDLTGNDVVRSIGYLEGLLHATVRQRSLLSRAIKIREAQWGPIRPIVNFSTLVQDEVTRVSDEQVTGFDAIKAQCLWLSVILNTSANITAAQAKLGKTNEFDSIVQGLREWSKKFSERADATQREVLTLPSYIWSQAHTDVEASMMQMLGEFREIFNTWMEECPLPRAILQHIEPFIGDHIAITTTELPESARSDLEAKCKDIFAALDLILGAMQDVETALKDVPTSTEDASWLVNEEQALSVAIVNLHSGQITKALQNIVDQIHCLQQTPHLQAIATLFAAVMPILNQYMASHEYLVAKLDSLHTATAKLLYRLAKSFIQVGTQGFCTPPEKSSENQPGKDDKLESGTGLGEGEGAEDISKDIEEDEDLEDLAQEKGGEREGSIEEEEDAVDMGENEMEGEMGEVADKEDDEGEGEEGDDDIQSEVGSVDDLGPSAVDEKMWDEGGKDDDDAKDKEGKQDVGTENQDEQVAAEDKDKKEKGKEEEEGEKEEGEGADEDEDADMQGEEQEENIGVGETEQMDPHAKEEETLDLPDELNLEGDEDEKENDDMGDMDMGDDPEEEMDTEEGAKPDTIDEEIGSEHEDGQDQDTTDHKKDDEEMGDEEEEGDEPVDDDAIPLPDEQAPPDEPSDAKNDTEADPNAEAGAGAEANDEAHQHENEQASASAANQDKGAEDATSENNQEAAAEDGTLGQTTKPDAGGRGEDAEESPETQSFKKLGDVLERWYNQQRQISDAKEKDETQIQQIDKEVDMADADFEHVPDDETQADTQALGTATEEQAKALDEDMAMAVDEEEKIAARPEDNDEQVQEQEQDMDMPDAESKQEEQEVPQSKIDGQPQAFVGEQKPFEHQQDQDMSEALPAEEDFSETSSVDDVETQLESTHLDPSILPTPETARQLWLRHESSTHSLSQQLTEHLRLILAPTLATKLRGDFRTGKRLNLKRIIPYIASGYKRDKIWLRRSMPSKRNYQVMIALDDSKSMAESGASNLALKTLTLVTRSLSMLEVGEVSVVGFGDQVNVAHDFDKPFTSDAGVRVFEQFGFAGSKTNVRGLVDKSLGLFEEARRKGSGVGEELWQLMLIVSDGICDSHAEIQRLVRKAQEERVMIVFIIIDATATPPTAADPSATEPAGPSTLPLQPQTDTAMQKKSILDLQAVDISPDGKIDRWKYMERFPFRYYLVVRDVRELPGVLAGALRQWFGEVAGSA
jgi:midasin